MHQQIRLLPVSKENKCDYPSDAQDDMCAGQRDMEFASVCLLSQTRGLHARLFSVRCDLEHTC